MSILIKDMEMPKDCPMCPMAHYDTLNHFRGCEVVPGKRHAMNDPNYANTSTRPDWCPLIELPPHGRLIDADAFTNKHFDKAYFDMVNMGDKLTLNIALTNIPIVLNNAPTILEAEVEDETLE